MTYVPGFTHDIFVSYPMEAEAWTHQLVEELKQAPGLAALKDLKFYFAKSDWRLGQASDEMLAAARSGALLMAVVTKDALSEEQTRFLAQEVRAFRESGSLRAKIRRASGTRIWSSSSRKTASRCGWSRRSSRGRANIVNA